MIGLPRLFFYAKPAAAVLKTNNDNVGLLLYSYVSTCQVQLNLVTNVKDAVSFN